MNPILVQWKALPLWAKLVLLPFVISGVVTAVYITVAAVLAAGAGIAAVLGYVSSLFRRAERRTA